jgi:hypothetical protein
MPATSAAAAMVAEMVVAPLSLFSVLFYFISFT